MQVILDQPLVQQDQSGIKYGGFWPRLGALIIDGIILSPITFGVTYFNITQWKSAPLMLALTLLAIAYKPFMEFTYGATLGKMALGLKVTNLNFERADLGQVLLRNIFNIAPSLVTLVISFSMYNDPDFQDVSGYQEFLGFSQGFVANQFVSGISSIIAIVELIMILSDDRRRSLHDRMAGTFVVQK
jgi:uncharacterized RDD family membrane protein YckC